MINMRHTTSVRRGRTVGLKRSRRGLVPRQPSAVPVGRGLVPRRPFSRPEGPSFSRPAVRQPFWPTQANYIIIFWLLVFTVTAAAYTLAPIYNAAQAADAAVDVPVDVAVPPSPPGRGVGVRAPSAVPPPWSATEDPFRRVAMKALAGEFGKLRPWQAAAYERGLRLGTECRHVWLTQYGPWEGYKGADYHIAANPRYLPMNSVVWLDKPGQLRVVTNRGADYNDRVACAPTTQWVTITGGKQVRGKGCAHWVDLWTRYRGQYNLDTTTANAYVIPYR